MTNPKKIPSWLAVLTLVGLGISVSPHRVLTRTAEVDRAPNPVLSDYDVIRRESGVVEQQVRTTEAAWRIDTVAGGAVGDNGRALQAPLYSPQGLAVDGSGNLYIADRGNHRIRRVDPAGTISTFAGTGESGMGGDNRPAVQARLGGPGGVAVDGSGNLYIADTWNHRIRRVDPSGTITTVAGSGERGHGGDDGPAVQARLHSPRGLAVDGAGNLYIADSDNNRIRRVDPSGTITTVAGSGERGYGGGDGPAVTAQLYYPRGLAVDSAGNLYIADTNNHRIRRVDPAGTITTVAGTEEWGFSGDGGPAVAAQLYYPRGLATDSAGYLYIADWGNDRIRRVDPSGTIATIAGTGRTGSSGDNGPAVAAQLQNPTGLAVDSAGNLLISDSWNRRIRRVDPSGTITAIAGTDNSGLSGDNGPAVAAQLGVPQGLAVDGGGYLYIADILHHRIRRVDPLGIITTIAGTGEPGFDGDDGPATDAQIARPNGVAVDGGGNLYIADSLNDRIRRVDPSGTISTVAGTGESGFSGDNGPAVAAQLDFPLGVAVDSAGNLYIADSLNHRIRRVDPSGTISTVAGTGESGFSGDDGAATEAQIAWPNGVAVDGASNLYIGDYGNHRIRRVDPSGTITTVAGTGKSGFSGDGGAAVAAQIFLPEGLAVDGSGNLYIADTWNHRIRRVDPLGTISTIAGTSERGFGGDGGPAVQARLNRPQAVAVDSAGNLYIADTENYRIRILSLGSPFITLQAPTALTATAVSSSKIDLTWQDNSHNETGFRIQRRLDGSSDWIEVGTTSANVTSFSHGGLETNTTYRYRVQAFNSTGASTFSNEAVAKTLEGPVFEAGWTIDTYAGGAIGDNGPGVAARLDYPLGVAVDRAGNLYIADASNYRIRRVDPSGTITTIAGTGERGFSGDNGPAVAARLDLPLGVAVDGAGNLYIADYWNHRIRRVDPSGTITTFAGTGESGFSGDNGPAVEAHLKNPRGVVVDGTGNLYIADASNHRIRQVDPSGTITTIAGTGKEGFSGDNGTATEAQLAWPYGLAVDAAGNLYVADSENNRIRRVDTTRTITTIAGTGEPGFSGDNGPAVEARLDFPRGVAVDGAGNLYVADSENNRVRRVDTTGTITTIAGKGLSAFSGDNGPAVDAHLWRPTGLAVDGASNLYIADSWNDRIRRVDPLGTITTIAGKGLAAFSGDNGPAVAAQLNLPRGLAVDSSGNLYIADSRNHRIRRVDPSGTITTIAGTGEDGFSGDGGPAVAATLTFPQDIAVDAAGNLYVADTWNNRIRKVDPSGTITTIAGRGVQGFSGDNGPAVAAQLYLPLGVALDPLGNLYVADTWNNRIRRVDPSGAISTIAGTGESGFSGDNGPAVAARLRLPYGITVDTAGNLYVADSRNERIRRVDPSGTISTIAGTGEPGFSGDNGPAAAAQLRRPQAVAVDGAGNLYIADLFNFRIRRVDTTGTITTIAGTGESGFSGDGGPAIAAQLDRPSGVAVDAAGNLYIADWGNHRIRILTPPTPAGTLQAPTNLTARAVPSSRIDLSWQDNSTNETGFRLQRRLDGSGDWIEVGTTAANVNTFSDAGLEPTTAYRYRVQAFNSAGASAFSNEAVATTEAAAPSVSGFVPTGGPAGTRVTLAGTGFLGTTEVSFNGVSAVRFEILSMTSLRAVVPQQATSGPISVVTPNGTGVSAGGFTVTDGGILSRLFVPIVLRLGGQAGSFYTSELTLTNRTIQVAGIRYTYTGSIGTSSGTAVDSLAAGRQRIVPDAITYLTSLGVPIGGGGAGGTLQVDFSGLSSASEGAVTVRTSTLVPDGRAGLAYLGLNALDLLNGPAWLTGLRQNTVDRSNLALQNAGDEAIALRVTVFSGDPATTESVVLADKPLAPGEFFQYNAILATAGFDQGYVKVERVSGSSPYYAYGVINDQANSDGSFVFPVTEDSLEGKAGQTLPVIVETEFFNSELTVTNFSPVAKTVDFSFVANAIQTANNAALFSLRLQAGEQRMIPNIVNSLRQQGDSGIGPQGPVFAGAVFATVANGDISGIVIGARTGSPGGDGQYGVFYNAVPDGSASTGSAWIYGLQQNSENRSNLALVNTGEVDGNDSVFHIDIYDGDTGRLVGTASDITVPSRRWRQVNRILAQYAPGTSQGYVQVKQTSGNNPFIAYGVINDGGAPGQRSGDGAFLPSQE